ncbi:hypothetical protein [Streptomyces sp. NPDC092307]|uniref:hypothetical protein n=1 Tax=Streptomyces sp. NPDC092307 TaxID=3366013 RepID=UPI00382EA8C0
MSIHGEVDRARGQVFGEVAGSRGGLPSGRPDGECRRDGRFTDLRAVRYQQHLYYDTDRHLGFLASLSRCRALPCDRREQALAETAQVLDAHGGGISMVLSSDLFLARVR